MAENAWVYFDYSIFTEANTGSHDKNLDKLVKYIRSLGIDIYISDTVLHDIEIYNKSKNLNVNIDHYKYLSLEIDSKFKDIALELYSIDTHLTCDIPISLHANIAICALNEVDFILSYDMPALITPDFILKASNILNKHKLELPMICTPDTFHKIMNNRYDNLAYCFAWSVELTVTGNDDSPYTYIEEVIHASKTKYDIDITKHERLVKNIAKKYVDRGVDIEDLIQEGNLGLLAAKEAFVGDSDDSFKKFAKPIVVIYIEAAIRAYYSEQTTRVLSTLTPREEKVLRMRFGIREKSDPNLEEVGQDFEVTRERIRQIEAKALRKLRHPSRSKELKSFVE